MSELVRLCHVGNHSAGIQVWFMQFHDRKRMVELLVCGFVFDRF